MIGSDWTPSDSPPPDRLPVASIAILGTDAFLAALPATSGQLVQACVSAGYAAAVPASWGDELVASGCLRRLAERDSQPAILCACPHVADRLPELGTDMARLCVPLVAPPVAAARYLRALYGGSPVRITYVGACPSAADAAIDARVTPDALLAALADRGIDPAQQPADARTPAGHRRFRSVAGGAPSPDALWAQGGRMLVEVVADDYAGELTERLRTRERALFDLAPRLGCTCSGAIPECPPHTARAAVAALEPPRARGDVLDPGIDVDVDRPLPLAATVAHPASVAGPARERGIVVPADRAVPASARKLTPLYTPRRRFRTSGFIRTVPGRGAPAQPPVTRTGEGRLLPRAYLGARHRVATGSIFAVTTESSPTASGEREVQRSVQAYADANPAPRTPTGTVVVPIPSGEPYRVPPPDSGSAGRGLLIATAVVVAVIVVAALLIW